MASVGIIREQVRVSFLVSLTLVSVSLWNLGRLSDDAADELISPSCRTGSLQSWQGRPCVIIDGH